MRLRTELLLASALVALCFGMTWHAAQAQDDCPGSPDMKCGGSANCLGDTCITQPSEGRSCAMATAIDHKKCITGAPGTAARIPTWIAPSSCTTVAGDARATRLNAISRSR